MILSVLPCTMSWRPHNKAAKDNDVLARTCTYQYILVCTGTYWYKLVQTSTYQYVQVHTCTYAYILFLALIKKSANRSRTRNLVHTSPRVYPCAMGQQTLMPVKVRNYVSAYIIWFCQTPCQCTWRLMTNRLCLSRRAATPSHDIPRARPSLDVDLVEA
jgi:hypothetical protein